MADSISRQEAIEILTLNKIEIGPDEHRDITAVAQKYIGGLALTEQINIQNNQSQEAPRPPLRGRASPYLAR